MFHCFFVTLLSIQVKFIMKKFVLYTGAILLSSILFASCVSSKKYNAAQASIEALNKYNRELKGDLQNTNDRLKLMEQAYEAAVGEISLKDSSLTNQSSQLASQQSELLRKQEELQRLQQLIDQQKQQTEKLRQKMAEALGGFNSDQLSVFTKNGKVYVSLSEKLLFPSGSAEVNKEGKEALGKIAEALEQSPDININIEGHTDTVPIKLRFQDNWALSVARSTAVLRILTQNYQMDPKRFTASGRSQYEPVADNDSSEGRALNRRTEIILAPNLSELMNIIEGK